MGRTTFPWLYVPYDAYAGLTGLKGQSNYLAARLAPGADGQAVMNQLIHVMEQTGYKIESAIAEADQSAAERSTIDVIMICLLAIVALTALVGGIGLSSTLSISVMERRREIGILRSMGARPALIRRLVLTEGLLIGLFSIVLSWPLAWLFTLILGKALVESAFGIVPTLVYLPEAAFAWAGLVCILALLSSWLPARQAGKLSIREILIYLG
jgi:putative ABC transport system permease protein